MLAALPILADIMFAQHPPRRCSLELPLSFLYCFPRESTRQQLLPALRRMASALERCQIVETIQGMFVSQTGLQPV